MTPGRAAQYRAFEAHIELAKQYDLALQIHDRDAHAEVFETLKRVGAPERTVFHCFSGDAEFAKRVADEGWYLSFAGTVTFKNAANLREALEVIPRSRILIESDAPYLTPMPYRGRPNAPYLIPYTRARDGGAPRNRPLDALRPDRVEHRARLRTLGRQHCRGAPGTVRRGPGPARGTGGPPVVAVPRSGGDPRSRRRDSTCSPPRSSGRTSSSTPTRSAGSSRRPASTPVDEVSRSARGSAR